MKRLIPLLMLITAACQASKPSPTAYPSETPAASATVLPTDTLVPADPTLTATPDPYEPYTTDFLRSRTYGGGNIEVTAIAEDNFWFTRYFIRYPSDGLNIEGFVNVPKGDGPFPVIIALHGFVNAADYTTLDYTTAITDTLTQGGYIIFHPNLRGYPPSDNGDSLFRVGLAVDVLNLIELIKSKSGPSELFAAAVTDSLGLWGHSMGGNISLRVLTVSSDIKAAVLWASMGGDELKNAELLFSVSFDPIFQTELAAPPNVFERISPMHAYSHITAPIQLHHGTADQTVSIAQAVETCDALKALGVQIECIYYPDEDHTFRARVADQFYGAIFRFYDTYLSP